jgi:hypothetical protein
MGLRSGYIKMKRQREINDSKTGNRNKKPKVEGVKKVSRLYPLATLPVEFEVATTSAKNQKDRALQLKAAWLKHEQLPSSQYEVGTCLHCFGTCYMNRKDSKMFCRRCATSNRFISTLFLRRDYNRDDNIANTTSPSTASIMTNLRRFGEQWSSGFTPFSIDILEFMYQQYRIYNHSSDPYRVQTSKTYKLIDGKKETLKSWSVQPGKFKSLRNLLNSTERLTKELRGDGIPEFQPKDLNLIYHVRESLGTLDNEDEKDSKQTLSNGFFFRQIARIHGLVQGRLFQHVKTRNIFIKQARVLETALLEHDNSYNESYNIRWQMFPCT